MKEDAQAAYDKISTEGITLASRKLRVDWADHKVSSKPHKYLFIVISYLRLLDQT